MCRFDALNADTHKQTMTLTVPRSDVGWDIATDDDEPSNEEFEGRNTGNDGEIEEGEDEGGEEDGGDEGEAGLKESK